MAKFKVGDRVRVTSQRHQERGKIGTVIEDSRNPWVAFDHPTNHGGTANTSLRGWVAGHMDVVAQCHLELVEGTLTVETCIALYRGACEQFEAAELALEKAKAAVQDARLNLRDALGGET